MGAGLGGDVPLPLCTSVVTSPGRSSRVNGKPWFEEYHARAYGVDLVSEPFDGERWECEKCRRRFNLLEADDFRCPECREQVSLNEVADQIARKGACAFQSPLVKRSYQGLGCELTAWGQPVTQIGAIQWFHSGIAKLPCQMEKCPMYQLGNF